MFFFAPGLVDSAYANMSLALEKSCFKFYPASYKQLAGPWKALMASQDGLVALGGILLQQIQSIREGTRASSQKAAGRDGVQDPEVV